VTCRCIEIIYLEIVFVEKFSAKFKDTFLESLFRRIRTGNLACLQIPDGGQDWRSGNTEVKITFPYFPAAISKPNPMVDMSAWTWKNIVFNPLYSALRSFPPLPLGTCKQVSLCACLNIFESEKRNFITQPAAQVASSFEALLERLSSFFNKEKFRIIKLMFHSLKNHPN